MELLQQNHRLKRHAQIHHFRTESSQSHVRTIGLERKAAKPH